MNAERAFAIARARWHWLIPALVLGGLLAPLALTDRTFASDWGNHLWLIQAQGLNIADLGEPSYYLQSSLGAFYPYFAFYGGSLYAVLGFVSWAAGPEAAAIAAFVVALAVAYLSWTWLAVQAGIRGWLIQIPGCLAVTAPYAVTNLYGRGDIPEMIATSFIPLIAAAGLSLLREPRIRLRSAAAFTIGVAVLTGTHTLTLVWGTTFLILCAALLVACNWRLARERRKRSLRLVCFALLGLALNAWMLAPLILYHARLLEGGPDPLSLAGFTDRGQLFSIFRNGAGLHPELTGDLNTQLPVLVLFWAIAFGATYWSLMRRESRKLAAGLAIVFGAFLLLVMAPSLIDKLPDAWRYIQFPYRLLTYADLALVAATVLVLVAVQRAGAAARAAGLLLAAIAAFAFAQSLKQNVDVRSWLPDRDAAVASAVHPPPTWYAPPQFADGSAPIVKPTIAGMLRLPVSSGPSNSYSLSVPPGPAGTVRTNILSGTYLVDVSGARPVGRTPKGQMVVRLPSSHRPRQVTVRAAWGTAVEIGRWISLAAIAISIIGAACALAMLPERRKLAPLSPAAASASDD